MKSARFVTHTAIIAALYVVLTEFSAMLGLSSGVVQIRFSEAMAILPVFTPFAISGLFLGCLISNILVGGAFWDIIFGSFATLLGALGTYYVGKVFLKNNYGIASGVIASMPPVAANTLIIPFVLRFVYNANGAFPFFFLTVFAGEFISVTILGTILTVALGKRKNIFKL